MASGRLERRCDRAARVDDSAVVHVGTAFRAAFNHAKVLGDISTPYPSGSRAPVAVLLVSLGAAVDAQVSSHWAGVVKMVSQWVLARVTAPCPAATKGDDAQGRVVRAWKAWPSRVISTSPKARYSPVCGLTAL